MLDELQHHANHVLRYEDWDLQDKAREVIPVDALHKRAREKEKAPGNTLAFQDLVLIELMHWFKFEFFKWVNEAPCDRGCATKTVGKGGAAPTPTEAKYGAGRVELYECQNCRHVTRFPRYGDPEILLQEPNRRGRCGEWANAFTLCCRSLGYDARHVVDWTDHVWTEVYSDHLNRWVHMDPCEAAWDSPLIYETGWGKKLSYVIAFSADEVVDVTRRYTLNYPEVLKRRTIVPEPLLQQFIMAINAKKRENDSREKIVFLLDRMEREQKDFDESSKRTAKTEETVGRQSGSLEWRQSRKEVGASSGQSTAILPSVSEVIFTSDKIQLANYRQSLQCNGSAYLDFKATPLSLILTPALNDCRGSIWLKTPLETSKCFVLEFGFRLSPGTQPGADGFAFVIQNDAKNISALGEGGAGLGYAGLTKALAVEFDVYQTVDRTADPDSNHIGIHCCRGSAALSAHHTFSIASTSTQNISIPPLNNGNVYHCLIVHDASEKKFEVLFTDKVADDTNSTFRGKDYINLLTVSSFNLSTCLANGYNMPDQQPAVREAFIGFTAATGGLNEKHELFNVSLWKLQ